MKLAKRFLHNCLQPRIIVPVVATLLWTAMVLLVPPSPITAVVSISFLVSVPGYVLYRVVAGYPRRQLSLHVLGYSVGLSLLVLMLLGLALNQLLPAGGIFRPLVASNMVPAIAGFTLFFTLAAAFRRRTGSWRRYLDLVRWQTWRSKPVAFWWTAAAAVGLLALPLLAIGGATMLNNNGPNWLALSAAGLAIAGLLGLGWTNRLSLQALYPLGLYSAALTLLLGTSMRGWEITGHDVMQEYQVFQLTNLQSLWDMSFYQDAYMACLSITMLPTILQKLSGIYDPYIFKLVFQVLFALIVPLMYSMLRTYVPRKVAFLAAALFMCFPAFLTDMAMLNRQEIALLFMALALGVSLDRHVPRIARHVLLILFLGAMVLSHYSTSYVAAGILLVATGVGLVLWLLQRWLGHKVPLGALAGPKFTIFPLYAPLLVVAMIAGWNGLATQTLGNFSNTVTDIGGTITRVVSQQTPGAEVQVDKTTTSAEQYAQYAEKTRPLPSEEYYPDASNYKTHEMPPVNASVAAPLQQLGVRDGALETTYGLIRQGFVALLTGLLALGLVLMACGRVATRLPVQYVLLGVAGVVVMVLQLVLPAAINYGLARVIQQSLIILVLPAVLAAVWLLGLLRLRFAAKLRVATLGIGVFLLVLSGVVTTVTGGSKPVLAFSNSGFYYQAYYTHPEEIAADRWLTENIPEGSRVYADEFSRRRLITYANIFAEPTLVPAAIPVDSYVYLSRGNTTTGQVPVYYQGELLFYNVPTQFLEAHKTLVYNSGGVRIYR